jgi:tetratricopeptide (TPR) repeat protein
MSYYNLGPYSCPITTASPKAQQWFDRGLNWIYGYNHEEAVVCFQKAARHDPTCAMAQWGIAYAAGPNYNMPWDNFDDASRAEALSTCFKATQAALACPPGTLVEQAFVAALPARFPQPELTEIEEMERWNDAFADAMRVAFEAHPDHMDLRAIFVEAMMNRTPWLMWDLAQACPADGADTVECQEVLEDAMENDPRVQDHPGLLHLYVHLMEMSPTPEKALKAADRLRTMAPDAGHLIHMPSHIDVLCGDYQNVVHWNQQAVVADLKYLEREGAFNIYTGYRIHNYHFIIYGAMFLGQFAPAMEAVRGIRDTVPEALLRIESPPMADYFESYMSFEPHVLVRFGRWEEAIRLPLPENQKLYCSITANVHYARGVAHAALGQVAEAEAEQTLFRAAAARVPESRRIHNNTMRSLLEIAKAMLEGEILYRKEAYDEAFAALRRSVHLEDTLPYDEPWGWMQPSRHALGALLFEQGHLAEAEATFREDLGLGGQLSRATVHTDNIWALKGLYDCLKARGDTHEIAHIRQRLDLANARADAAARAPCFCAQAAMASCCDG